MLLLESEASIVPSCRPSCRVRASVSAFWPVRPAPTYPRWGTSDRHLRSSEVQRQAPRRGVTECSTADENTRTHQPCTEGTAVPHAAVPLYLYSWR